MLINIFSATGIHSAAQHMEMLHPDIKNKTVAEVLSNEQNTGYLTDVLIRHTQEQLNNQQNRYR